MKFCGRAALQPVLFAPGKGSISRAMEGKLERNRRGSLIATAATLVPGEVTAHEGGQVEWKITVFKLLTQGRPALKCEYVELCLNSPTLFTVKYPSYGPLPLSTQPDPTLSLYTPCSAHSMWFMQPH